MTALNSKLKIMQIKIYSLKYSCQEVAQLGKVVSYSNPKLSHKTNISEIWQVNTLWQSHDLAYLHSTTTDASKIKFLHLTFSKIWLKPNFKSQGHYSKVKGRIKVTPWQCTATSSHQCPYEVSTSYTLQFLRYNTDKILKIKVTMARSKVKSRSHYDIAHLHLSTNVPTKYQLPKPYGFRDIAQTRF